MLQHETFTITLENDHSNVMDGFTFNVKISHENVELSQNNVIVSRDNVILGSFPPSPGWHQCVSVRHEKYFSAAF